MFGEFLYWKATEPVDWVLNTNNNPANQYVNYESTEYDFAPSFRVGAAMGGEWSPRSRGRTLKPIRLIRPSVI